MGIEGGDGGNFLFFFRKMLGIRSRVRREEKEIK
jgi:hypothetical protein